MTITAKFSTVCPRCGQRIQVGEKIEWEKGKKATHLVCSGPEKKEAHLDEKENYVTLTRGEGYGYGGFTEGQILRNPRNKEQILTVVKTWQRYISEDGMSFGVGDESGYLYYAKCREASEEEIDSLLECEGQAAAKKAAEAKRNEIAKMIRKNGERPNGMSVPEGEKVSDRQNIYGCGDWFVIGEKYIWYVLNNGSDGDDWSFNNVRTGGAGAIGWRINRDEDIVTFLKSL